MNPIRRANLYTLFVLTLQLLMAVLFALAADRLPSLPYSIALSSIATQTMGFLPPLLFYLWTTKANVRELLSLRRVNITNSVLVVLMCIVIQPAMSLLSAVSSLMFENTTSSYIFDMLDFPLPLALLAVAVVPALFEEITMRGVVFAGYAQLPIKEAAIMNGVLFAILHLNPQQFPYAFMMGVIFSYFVYYTKSIWSSVLAHFTVNATQILSAFASYRSLAASPDAEELLTPPSTAEFMNLAIFLVVLTAIFLPVFLILFRTFISYNRRRIIIDSLSEAVASDIDPGEPQIPEPSEPPRVLDWSFFCVVGVYVLTIIGLNI